MLLQIKKHEFWMFHCARQKGLIEINTILIIMMMMMQWHIDFADSYNLIEVLIAPAGTYCIGLILSLGKTCCWAEWLIERHEWLIITRFTYLLRTKCFRPNQQKAAFLELNNKVEVGLCAWLDPILLCEGISQTELSWSYLFNVTIFPWFVKKFSNSNKHRKN